MIRTATLDDIPALVKLGKQFYEAGPFKEYGLGFQETSVMLTTAGMINDPRNKIILVAENEQGEIVGFLGAYVAPWWSNYKQCQITETWYYVDPQYRKHGYGKELLNEIENVAKKVGAVNLVMVSLSESHQNKINRFYTINGFKALENYFIKRL